MKSSGVAFFERRKAETPIGIINRRISERRSHEKPISSEHRRLASQVRRYEREPFKIPVRLEAAGKEISGYTHDISPEGLLVYSDIVLSTGAPMTLQFSFGENFCYLNVSGQVVFRRLVEKEGALTLATGIRFSGVRDFEQKMLTSVVQALKQNNKREEKSSLSVLLSKNIQGERQDFSNRSSQPQKNAKIKIVSDSIMGNLKTKKDKRLESRKTPNNNEKILIDLSLSYPKGIKITKEVLDFSESGLSFSMSSQEGFFPIGTPLNNIMIRNGQKTYKTAGEVTNVTTLKREENPSYRIGVKFNREHKRFLGAKVSSFFPLRPHRYSAQDIPEFSKIVLFRDQSGDSYTGSILNFSKFGAAFVLENESPAFCVSQTLENFKVLFGDDLVFTGNATVINLKNDMNGITIGVSFESEQIDLEKIFNGQIKSLIEQELSNSIPSFKAFNRINASFKSEVADLRYFLENLKKEFENHELKIQSETTDKKKVIHRCVLESAAKYAYPIIDTLMSRITELTQGYDKDLDNIHKEYFRVHLHELLLEGPFIQRSYKKPLGYAGDYEMMNMLYREPYEGVTLFGKFINGYSWQLPSAKAVRNRVPYILSKIGALLRDKVSEEGKMIVSITSVGCGPAKEIQDFLNTNVEGNECEINLVDLDRTALLYCQDKILEIKALKKRQSKINFFHKSINDLLVEKENFFLKKQDLIYSLGLFDYFTADISRELILIFYQALNPNGALIIGNFDLTTEMSNKKQMEYVTEWYLIHRNEEELMDLTSKLPSSNKHLVEKDSTNVNNFLIIKKQ